MAVEVITPHGAVQYVGLSSDSKPTPPIGSTFYETDTGAKYIYAGAAWGIDLRDGQELHVRKTINFTTTPLAASGNLTVFTITGRVWVVRVSAFCTTLLGVTGAPTISLGDVGDIDGFIAVTTAADIDANEWWNGTVPAASGGYGGQLAAPTAAGYATFNMNKYLSSDVRVTASATATSVDSGIIIFDMWYIPITDNGRLVAA